jgi:hypothetical protein
LLELLSIKRQGWHFVIILDESWSYLCSDHEQIWLRAEQGPPERAKQTIQKKKIMVTIAWIALGFHLIEAVPKGRGADAEYYRNNILTEPIRFCPQAGDRHLIIHAANASPHTGQKCRTSCAENGLGRPTHPPCSPDLALSDFVLFGYVEHRLQGIVSASGEEFLAGIREVAGQIPLEILARVFEH